MTTETTFERHYRLSELSSLWRIGRETLRQIFSVEPGVVKIRMGRKRKNTTYAIPASVADRVHRRLGS
jgi:hypothetical protein